MKELLIKNKNLVYIIVILVSGFFLYNDFFKERYNWNNVDKKSLTKRCMIDLGKLAKEYPKEAIEYCKCTTEIIVLEFDKINYFEIVNDTSYLNVKYVTETMYPCLPKLKEQIGL